MHSYTFYFAGELFSQKHLTGNALLAQAIYTLSEGKYLPILPQDLEFREITPQAIRDQDLLSLLQCDLALFNFDGPELDSGTVVEFMFAKFADIPSVLLRTDFREGGDQAGGGEPWNLMCSFYPRTETVLASCLETTTSAGHQRQSLDSYDASILEQNLQAPQAAINLTAQHIIDAFDQVIAEPSILRPDLADAIYQHLLAVPNFKAPREEVEPLIQRALHQKRTKGLLPNS